MLIKEKTKTDPQKKGVENLSALLIVAIGAFIGSLFVDVTHLVRGSGFTDKALQTTSVLEHSNRTWVAYKTPIVPVIVLTRDDCDKCDASNVLTWLSYVMPTVQARSVDIGTPEGQSLAEKYKLVALPSIIFDNTLTSTAFYSEGAALFDALGDGGFTLRTGDLGMAPGEYISAPQNEHAIIINSDTITQTVTLLGNFACKDCARAHTDIMEALTLDKTVRYAFVYAPMSDDDVRGARAVTAAMCADHQGAFIPYARELYKTSHSWRRSKNDRIFMTIARGARVKSLSTFRTCLSGDVYVEKVENMARESSRFGLVTLPGIFVGSTMLEEGDDLQSALGIVQK